MNTWTFLMAIWIILLTPGPTNTLMAVSGTQVGLVKSLWLVPAELCGYLLAVVPLAFLGTVFFEHWPLMSPMIQTFAAIWVMYLAVRLWLQPAIEAERILVTRPRVFLTTLLNPKALLFGLVLLQPALGPMFLPHLMLFALSIGVAAVIWASLGTMATGDSATGEARGGLWINRAAAVWLAFLSSSIAIKLLIR